MTLTIGTLVHSNFPKIRGGVIGRLELLENSSAVLVARPVPNDPIESGPSQLKNGGFIGEA